MSVFLTKEERGYSVCILVADDGNEVLYPGVISFFGCFNMYYTSQGGAGRKGSGNHCVSTKMLSLSPLPSCLCVSSNNFTRTALQV